MSKDYQDEPHLDGLTKGPGGFETDNPYVEGAIAVAVITGVGLIGAALYKVGKGIGKFFTNSKVELDEVDININGNGMSGTNSKRKKS